MGVGYISVNIDMGTKLRELSGTNQKISSGNFKISSTWESIKILLLLEHYQLMVVICSLCVNQRDFTMKIDFTEFWDSNYYNNQDLTDEIITQAERKLGVKLPKTFIELLKVQNGGYTKGFAFLMKTKTTWADNHIPLSELFGIILDEKSDSVHNIMQSSYLIKEWGLPEKQVLLTGDGHWWITLDYRVSDNPTIRWIDCECDEDIHVANSFDEFYNGLVSEDEFAEQ